MVERQAHPDRTTRGTGDDCGLLNFEVVQEVDGIVRQVLECERLRVVLRETGASAVVPDQLETVAWALTSAGAGRSTGWTTVRPTRRE